MDVYDYLKSSIGITKEPVQVPVRRIAEDTGLSLKQVRTQISHLESKGYIEVREVRDPKTHAQLASAYRIIGIPPTSPYKAEVIRAVYLKYVAERTGKPVFAYKFVNSRDAFSKMAELCEALDMDPHAYILACFYVMPAAWCRQKFKMPYPPPNLLTNKAKARERYDTFIRQFQHEDDTNPGPLTWVMQSIHIIKKLNMQDDVKRMAMFVKTDNILPEVFMCMPSVKREDWKMADINEANVRVEILKVAHRCTYAEFANKQENKCAS